MSASAATVTAKAKRTRQARAIQRYRLGDSPLQAKAVADVAAAAAAGSPASAHTRGGMKRCRLKAPGAALTSTCMRCGTASNVHALDSDDDTLNVCKQCRQVMVYVTVPLPGDGVAHVPLSGFNVLEPEEQTVISLAEQLDADFGPGAARCAAVGAYRHAKTVEPVFRELDAGTRALHDAVQLHAAAARLDMSAALLTATYHAEVKSKVPAPVACGAGSAHAGESVQQLLSQSLVRAEKTTAQKLTCARAQARAAHQDAYIAENKRVLFALYDDAHDDADDVGYVQVYICLKSHTGVSPKSGPLNKTAATLPAWRLSKHALGTVHSRLMAMI